MKVRLPVVALAAALTLWPLDRAMAQDATVFTSPPSAEELADILFPAPAAPRTRSIVIDEGPDGPDPIASALPGADPDAATTGAGASPESGAGDAPGAFGLMINFAHDEAEVLAESIPYLDSVGRMLNLERAGNRAVVIEGHTDATGGTSYNQRLSEERALAVRRYLMSVHGIDASRLHPVGKGETSLHDANDPSAAVNRRVEFRRLDRSDDGA